jgi:hypothetical protein
MTKKKRKGRVFSPEEEAKKRELFEAMSPRRQAKIMKKGYDYWDPFQEPRDPRDQSPSAHSPQSALLLREFVTEAAKEDYENSYIRGAWEVCQGLNEEDPKYRGIYDFCVWLSKRKS